MLGSLSGEIMRLVLSSKHSICWRQSDQPDPDLSFGNDSVVGNRRHRSQDFETSYPFDFMNSSGSSPWSPLLKLVDILIL